VLLKINIILVLFFLNKKIIKIFKKEGLKNK